MTGACKLNNKSMRNIRHSQEYQCAMIDLMLLGIITKEQCEKVICSGVPEGLVLPGDTYVPPVVKTIDQDEKQPDDQPELPFDGNITNDEGNGESNEGVNESSEDTPDTGLPENSEQTEE